MRMRRREKFVVTSFILSLGLLGTQYVALEWRYVAVAAFSFITYFLATWALREDLQRHERITVVPFPALYAASVSLFYFLLPESLVTQAAILVLFGVGMYGLLLTSNIYSVAKGRTIQLVYAAHAISMLFNIITSLFLANTIFSLKLPVLVLVSLIGITHFPLTLMSLWSVKLESRLTSEVFLLSLMITGVVSQIAAIVSFLPLSVWYSALFTMASLYIGLGITHAYLRDRLFTKTLREYVYVALFVGVIFVLVFPWK